MLKTGSHYSKKINLNMTSITVSRQLGSYGNEVAQAIAERLNFHLVSREVINQAALRAGVPEVALATIDDLGLLGIKPSVQARQAYHNAIREVLEELATQGKVVIVGRAGQVILRGRPDVFHIKVIAPVNIRAERLAREQHIPIEAATAQITTSDRSRREYLKRYFNARWDDPELYDIIINTARMEVDEAACLVCLIFEKCIHKPQ